MFLQSRSPEPRSMPMSMPGAYVPSYLHEVSARRWQNASNMSGISVHDLRMKHDEAYSAANAPLRVACPKSVVREQRCLSSVKVESLSGAQRAALYNKPSPRDFVREVQNRRRLLCWTMNELSRQMDVHQSTISNALSPSGHMSDGLRAKILAVLDAGERTLGISSTPQEQDI